STYQQKRIRGDAQLAAQGRSVMEHHWRNQSVAHYLHLRAVSLGAASEGISSGLRDGDVGVIDGCAAQDAIECAHDGAAAVPPAALRGYETQNDYQGCSQQICCISQRQKADDRIWLMLAKLLGEFELQFEVVNFSWLTGQDDAFELQLGV